MMYTENFVDLNKSIYDKENPRPIRYYEELNIKLYYKEEIRDSQDKLIPFATKVNVNGKTNITIDKYFAELDFNAQNFVIYFVVLGINYIRKNFDKQSCMDALDNMEYILSLHMLDKIYIKRIRKIRRRIKYKLF